QAGTFDWDERTQGLILSSFFWGYVVTHLPGGMLAERFGGKYSLGLGILSTAVLTLLTPLAATYGGANWLIGVRILEGLGEGSTFPAMNALLAQWAPPSERSRIGSLVFAGAISKREDAVQNIVIMIRCSDRHSGEYSPERGPAALYVVGLAECLLHVRVDGRPMVHSLGLAVLQRPQLSSLHQ
ncbi:unnamed protein product, partial [Timema podura]|nr:unnamed protein product [Timema podura]